MAKGGGGLYTLLRDFFWWSLSIALAALGPDSNRPKKLTKTQRSTGIHREWAQAIHARTQRTTQMRVKRTHTHGCARCSDHLCVTQIHANRTGTVSFVVVVAVIVVSSLSLLTVGHVKLYPSPPKRMNLSIARVYLFLPLSSQKVRVYFSSVSVLLSHSFHSNCVCIVQVF